MIEETLKIFVTEELDIKDLTFDFNKTSSREKELYESIIEKGPNQIIHFAGPDGYYADILWDNNAAVLVVPEKVYNDTGFQDLLFNLCEFGLCSIANGDFGYNIIFYNYK